MNQEIQQNTTENKKPRMYISWRIIFLNFFIVVGATNLLSIFQPPHGMWAVGLLLSLTLLPVGVILLLVVAFSKKPTGYVNTKITNNLFLGSILFVVPLVWLISSFAGERGGFNIAITFGYIVLAIVSVGITFVLNQKFQKPESELKIKQPNHK